MGPRLSTHPSAQETLTSPPSLTGPCKTLLDSSHGGIGQEWVSPGDPTSPLWQSGVLGILATWPAQKTAWAGASFLLGSQGEHRPLQDQPGLVAVNTPPAPMLPVTISPSVLLPVWLSPASLPSSL